MMMMKMGWVAVAAMAVGAAQAAEQPYVAVANVGTLAVYNFVEVWGFGATNAAYANPATNDGEPFASLTGVSITSSNAPLGPSAAAPSLHFGYDPLATATSTSANGRVARYGVGAFALNLPVDGSSDVVLGSASNNVTASVSASRNTQTLNFRPLANTVDGPLDGSTLRFQVPATAVTSQVVDLVSLLGPGASYSAGFDLSAFSTLPVHLRSPTEFYTAGLGMVLGRNVAGANFSPTLPASLELASFNTLAQIDVAFDGLFTVSVEAADYASPAAYAAANTWVQANIRQINVESVVSWDLDALGAAPVPEPSAAWLLALGVPVLAWRQRRRAQPVAA